MKNKSLKIIENWVEVGKNCLQKLKIDQKLGKNIEKCVIINQNWKKKMLKIIVHVVKIKKLEEMDNECEKLIKNHKNGVEMKMN